MVPRAHWNCADRHRRSPHARLSHVHSAGALAFTAVVLLSALRLAAHAASSSPVVEWHQIFNAATLAAVPVPNSLATSRSAALVSVSVFDAVNWHRPLVPAVPGGGACTGPHLGRCGDDSGGLRHPHEALSRAGGVPDRAPRRLTGRSDQRPAVLEDGKCPVSPGRDTLTRHDKCRPVSRLHVTLADWSIAAWGARYQRRPGGRHGHTVWRRLMLVRDRAATLGCCSSRTSTHLTSLAFNEHHSLSDGGLPCVLHVNMSCCQCSLRPAL